MDLNTFVSCPYCGSSRNVLKLDPLMVHGAEIILCDADAGCDRYFAVFWRANIETTTHAIEGKEP